MKTKFLIIALSIFSAVFLTACFGNEKEEETPPQPEQQEINADTILDNKLFEEAVNSNDTKRCDEIKTSSKKEECGTVLESIALMDQATQKQDKTICKKIKLERYASACDKDVLEAIAQAQKEQTELEAKEKQETLYAEIYEKRDIAQCDKLQENYKLACKENIINSLAVEDLDQSICKKHNDKEKQLKCEELVDINIQQTP